MRESHRLVPIWALKQERERSEEHQHCGSTANRTCAKGDLVSVLDRGEVVPELVSGADATGIGAKRDTHGEGPGQKKNRCAYARRVI